MKDLNIANEIESTFKTNINCSGCYARVKIEMDKLSGISRWTVNTLSPDKIMTVVSDPDKINEVVDAVKKAGYKIEPLN